MEAAQHGAACCHCCLLRSVLQEQGLDYLIEASGIQSPQRSSPRRVRGSPAALVVDLLGEPQSAVEAARQALVASMSVGDPAAVVRCQKLLADAEEVLERHTRRAARQTRAAARVAAANKALEAVLAGGAKDREAALVEAKDRVAACEESAQQVLTEGRRLSKAEAAVADCKRALMAAMGDTAAVSQTQKALAAADARQLGALRDTNHQIEAEAAVDAARRSLASIVGDVDAMDSARDQLAANIEKERHLARAVAWQCSTESAVEAAEDRVAAAMNNGDIASMTNGQQQLAEAEAQVREVASSVAAHQRAAACTEQLQQQVNTIRVRAGQHH